MNNETSKVTFLVSTYESEGRIHAKVVPTFVGLHNRDHHRRVLTSIAVNCVRQLGLIQGMERAIDEITALIYQSKIETLPKIEYEDESERNHLD